MFRRLIGASRARRIEAQTNDVLLTLMLYDCASGITSVRVVFHDALTTNLDVPGATFRRVAEADRGRHEFAFRTSSRPVPRRLITSP
jgi:hypothetical protein